MPGSDNQGALETFLGGLLFQDFEQHFEVVYANTDELRRVAYSIRYVAQSGSAHKASSSQSRMMIDGHDCHSHHILIRHRETQEFVGTIRLIVSSSPRELLPIQNDDVQSSWALPSKLGNMLHSDYSEISNIAILAHYQRRELDSQDAAANPMPAAGIAPKRQARDFPKITMGLYLAAIALARQLFHRKVFSIMPPMLFKKLRGYGLLLDQASHVFQNDGAKAVYYLNIEQDVQITKTLHGLNDCISSQLASQLHLFPSIDEEMIKDA